MLAPRKAPSWPAIPSGVKKAWEGAFHRPPLLKPSPVPGDDGAGAVQGMERGQMPS